MESKPSPREFSYPPPTFSASPASLDWELNDIKSLFDETHAKLLTQGDASSVSFGNTILPLETLYDHVLLSHHKARLLSAASDDNDIRTAATRVQEELGQLYNQRTKRRDIFERVDTIYQTLDKLDLDSESKKLIQDWYDECVRSGCALLEDKRKDLVEIDRQISQLGREFRETLFESADDLWLTREQLSGLPPSVLNGLEAKDGKLRLSLKTSLVIPVLSNVHDATVRKLVFEAEEASVSANVQIFTKLMQFKQQRAKLLGYSSYAEMFLLPKMAKKPETVHQFLGNLQKALTPKALDELVGLKELRRKHLRESQEEYTEGYYIWDQRYYHEMHLKESYEIDTVQISEYFPLEPALSGMLRIFEDVFHIDIKKVDTRMQAGIAGSEQKLTWQKDVGMYTVWEKNDTTKEGFIGFLYTDLMIRDGKFPNCANFTIRPGYTDGQGERHHVATALLCSFPPPPVDKPVLLSHHHIVQMFHELGHGMHDLLSRTRYPFHHGHAVPRDFVEMPSQMLEGWCWNPEELASISRHYSYLSPEFAEAWKSESGKQELPVERLPRALAEKLAATQGADIALSTLRQIAFSNFDMYIHGPEALTENGLKEFYRKNRDETGLIPSSDQDPPTLGHEFATMSHFAEGSSCSYYSYLFSKVYSADIFHSSFEKHLRDSEIGMKYRRMVLQPGGTQDPLQMVTGFLGRDPSPSAFHRSIGLDVVDQ